MMLIPDLIVRVCCQTSAVWVKRSLQYVTMFHHQSDTSPLVLSPVESEPDQDTISELIDNKNADSLAAKYHKSFSEFSFSSPFKRPVLKVSNQETQI